MDLMLQVLRVKGRATPDVLATAVDTDPTAVLARLVTDGLVEETRFGFRVTEAGNDRVDELYARERAAAGPVVDQVYESFVPINDELKQIVTDWQMRSVAGQLTVNDHSDHRHDDRVIARLRATDARASTALAPLTKTVSRFDVYPRRLARALAHVCDGDHSMLAAPLKDSYHTVWFELHEELIILAGRTRTE